MRRRILLALLTGTSLIAALSTSRAQTTAFVRPERQIGLSRDVAGQLTVSTVITNGCSVGPALIRTFTVREILSGKIAANGACDELGDIVSSNAIFQAFWYSDIRQGDWRGSHTGYFRISDGSVLVAAGSMIGTLGVGSHRGLEDCAICNHFEGALRGYLYAFGYLHGARIQATYAGNVIGTTCPSADIPRGAFDLALDGVVVSTNCPPTVGPQ